MLTWLLKEGIPYILRLNDSYRRISGKKAVAENEILDIDYDINEKC